MPDASTILITGVPAVIIIGIILEILKAAGLNPKYVPATAVALGVVLGIVAYVVHVRPDLTDVVQVILLGLVAGASTVGIHGAVSKTIKAFSPLPTPPGPPSPRPQA